MKRPIRISIIADAGGMMTQEHYEALRGLVQRIEAIEARLDAVAGVATATGGGTVDAEARAELAAIRTALA